MKISLGLWATILTLILLSVKYESIPRFDSIWQNHIDYWVDDRLIRVESSNLIRRPS